MTKHEYICKICAVVREKSNCIKRQVGAVFVNGDYEILATGYNEAPKGFPHCDNGKTCGDPCERTIHAEQNAIAQAAKRGTALAGSMLYSTYMPCVTCSRLLVNIGVETVLVKENNKDGGEGVLVQAGIEVRKWTK